MDGDAPTPSNNSLSLDVLPLELRCGHFDAVIFSSDYDAGQASRLAAILREHVTIPMRGEELGSRPVDICTLNDDGPLCCFQSWFDRLDEALERSTYSFFLLTPAFKDKDKAWNDIKRDEALMKMLCDDKYKNTVIPLHIQERRRSITPTGLRALTGIPHVEKLFESQPDPDIIAKFQNIFKENILVRMKRDQSLQQDRIKWWTENVLNQNISHLSITESSTSSMRPRERLVLTKNQVYLCENLYDVNCFLDDFIQAMIISSDTAEAIKVKPTSLDRKQAFLYQLQKWGPEAFQVFLDSLERNSYTFVKEHLEEKLQEEET